MSDATFALKQGACFPYDAPDSWWREPNSIINPPPPTDWAHAAARGVLADLTDRRDIKHGFDGIDEEVRSELVKSLSEIIREAHKQATTTKE